VGITFESFLTTEKAPAEIEVISSAIVVNNGDPVVISKEPKPGKKSVLWFCQDTSNIAAWFIFFKNGNSPFKNKHFGKPKGEVLDSGKVRPDVTPDPGQTSKTFSYTVVVILDNGSVLYDDPDVVVDM
jgi:hypothetical protein